MILVADLNKNSEGSKYQNVTRIFDKSKNYSTSRVEPFVYFRAAPPTAKPFDSPRRLNTIEDVTTRIHSSTIL